MRVTSVRIADLKSIRDSGLLELGPITLFVGRNNTGKSTVLRALHQLQSTGPADASQVRFGADQIRLEMTLTNVNGVHWGQGDLKGDGSLQSVFARHTGALTQSMRLPEIGSQVGLGVIQAVEPQYFIVPYLASRKVTTFEEAIDAQRSREVRINLSNLATKVDRLMDVNHPRHAEFMTLVSEVINLPISAIASPGGKQVGIWVNESEWIRIEQMGDGVSQMLGLITQLCLAREKLFLIEEIENDIHPEGLKALLRVITERSHDNQFVISTHNNIVLRHLGALPTTVIHEVTSETSETGGYRLPETTITKVGNDARERSRILESLGYEFSDLDLFDGWLILEEASAERIIRDHLVRWFAPGLSRVRTVASHGTSDLDRTFGALDKLVLFTHLQERYVGRVLVLADGDPSGLEAVEKLRATYTSWPSEAFATLSEVDFEKYYPAKFQPQVEEILARPKQGKRDGKRELLAEVLTWIGENEEEAKLAFTARATEVVEHLKHLEAALMPASDLSPS